MKKKYTSTVDLALIILLCLPSIHKGILGNTTESSADSTEVKKSPIIQYDTLAIITEPKGAKIEKNFDTIRNYESYDPTTKKWSAIEDFKTIDILTDTTQQHTEDYLYYSFWAYDPVMEQWKRVDIRSYGYLDSIPPKKPFKFWKNFGMSFSIGGGGTYYKNSTEGLNLLVRKGESIYLLQPKNVTNRIQGKGYRIRWFNKPYAKITNLKEEGVVHDENSLAEVKDETIEFTGFGINIPIMLNIHYTFFNRLRVGAGANMAINRLGTLGVEQITYTLDKPWFFNFKWFGTVAYKVFRKGLHSVLVDTQLGMVYDLGNEPIKNFKQFINNTFYGSLGVAHERQLNGFLSFFYRLSGEFKQYTSTTEFQPEIASVKLLQPALVIEAGITINFGRKKLPIDPTDVSPNEPVQESALPAETPTGTIVETAPAEIKDEVNNQQPTLESPTAEGTISPE
jgi:hypothetical protein